MEERIERPGVDICEVCSAPPSSPNITAPLKTWVVSFEVTGIGKGTAVIEETSAIAAENKLRHDGMYNGAPYLYKIIKTEEVIEPPCAGLMAEEVVTIAEVCNGPYVV